MKNVISILENIKNTSSTNDKINILKDNKDNLLLQKVLFYTYNPYLKYGISEQKINEMSFEKTDRVCKDVWCLLHELSVNNINDSLRKDFCDMMSLYDSEEQELIKSIVIKDLRIGINISSINKVWKNLIPVFKVQLANNYKDVKLLQDEKIFITEKLDGIRCLCIKTGSNIKLYTRQGKLIEGLNEVEKSISQINGDIVLDGELIVSDDTIESGKQYKETMKIVRTLNPNKTGITYHVFDILTTSEFKQGHSNNTYAERRLVLNNRLQKNQNDTLKVVPLLYEGNDHSKIAALLKQVTDNGREGIMINRNDYYKCNRNNSLLKVKMMYTCDLKVLRVEQGVGKYSDKLGNIVCEYKGYEVSVGSGFTDVERTYYWQNQDDIIGKIVEIQAFEETSNADGELSLRFPVFLHIRDDKTEPSYQ